MWYEGKIKVLMLLNIHIIPIVAVEKLFNIWGNTFIRRLAELCEKINITFKSVWLHIKPRSRQEICFSPVLD